MSDGALFNASQHLSDAAVDIIQAVCFGLGDDISTIKRQLDYLAKLNSSGQDIPVDADGAATFPHIPSVACITACFRVGEHAGSLFKSLFPKAFHHLNVLTDAQPRRNIAT